MKKRMMPVSRSAADAGIFMVDWMARDPFFNMAIKMETGIIIKGFSLDIQATMMAVKPTPPAVVYVRV